MHGSLREARLCAKLADVCSGDDDTVCASTCATDESGSCGAQWNVVADCSLDPATMFTCKNGKANSSSCIAEALMFADCESAAPFEISCMVPPAAPSLGNCHSSDVCNPVTDQGCANNEDCDIAQGGDGFQCYPQGSVTIRGACAPENGLHCTGGFVCITDPTGTCARYCCTDADCGSGSVCHQLDASAASICVKK